MSNNRECTCPVPPCELHGKTIYADPKQLKKYIDKNHDHSQLVDFAYKIGLIQSKNGYHSHDWLLEQFVKLGLKKKISNMIHDQCTESDYESNSIEELRKKVELNEK